LRYAYKVGELGGGEKEQAEGVTFAAAVLPKVHAYDAAAAKIIYDNMKIGAADTMDFRAVKAAFESTYAAMNVECAHVGGLWDDGNQAYYVGLEPCGLGLSTCEQPDNKGPGMTVVIDFTLDGYPGDTSWTLSNTCSGSEVVESNGSYTEKFASFTETYIVPSGTYDFTVLDYGDGLTTGDYTVTLNGVTVISYDKEVFKEKIESFGEAEDCPIGANSNAIEINFDFDDFPGDISWELFNTCNGGKVLLVSEGPGSDSTFSKTYNVEDGTFELQVKDSYGDGFPTGSFSASRNGVVTLGDPVFTELATPVVFGDDASCAPM